jgi:PIN domain nuclease of toxin-antitoxin system
MLVVRGRLKLDRDTRIWIDQALAAPSLELIPIDAEIGVTAAQLGPFGGDPADHLIVATALLRGARLVSGDERITDSGLVPMIW